MCEILCLVYEEGDIIILDVYLYINGYGKCCMYIKWNCKKLYWKISIKYF